MTASQTIVRTVVAPNGPGGCNGPPIDLGVISIMRIRDGAPTISVNFDDPRADLLECDFDSLSDNEIAAFGSRTPSATVCAKARRR